MKNDSPVPLGSPYGDDKGLGLRIDGDEQVYSRLNGMTLIAKQRRNRMSYFIQLIL
ncbi:MAG: hypothetical protein OHK0052_15480 [Anaerolineales bacterium]